MARIEGAANNSLPLKLTLALNLGLWWDQFASRKRIRIGNGVLIELLKYKRESNASNN